MQTFLPFPNFYDSASSLDNKRLGKQRLETYQIMLTLLTNKTALGEPRKGWQHHPAVEMWRGHEQTLLDYQEATVAAWADRGYNDTCWPKTLDVFVSNRRIKRRVRYPFWLGNSLFHEAHRSVLIQKKPDWYGPLFPDTPDNLEYIWPTREEERLRGHSIRRTT